MIQGVIIDPEDNIGVALEALPAGSKPVLKSEKPTQLTLIDPIPYQHKFSTRNIASGKEIIKHGVVVGVATKDIKKGEHVHIHNMAGLRARAAGK
jgi:altronate dehydratase small subunit